MGGSQSETGQTPGEGAAHRREAAPQSFPQDAVVEQHQQVGGRVHWETTTVISQIVTEFRAEDCGTFYCLY